MNPVTHRLSVDPVVASAPASDAPCDLLRCLDDGTAATVDSAASSSLFDPSSGSPAFEMAVKLMADLESL